MNAADVETLRRRLLDWYRIHRRDLPWRRTRDPYAIWVSEVMLQQTRVKTAVHYYRRFLKRFPDISRLAAADLQAVLKLWEGLGYYARARNLHRAARIVCDRHAGLVPDASDPFRQLPGVGEYIAAAVQSIAFDRPLAVVDGNVKRVLARLYCIDAPANHSSSAAVFRRIAEELLDSKSPGTFNQALMELGALICRPQSPECDRCPLERLCSARATDAQQRYPVRQKKPPAPEHHRVVAVIRRGAKYLILRRKEQGLLGGLWEFPAARIAPGEAPEAACGRAAQENVRLHVKIGGLLMQHKHTYTHFTEILEVFCCRSPSGRVQTSQNRPFRWVRLQEVDRFPFTGASLKIIGRLRSESCGG